MGWYARTANVFRQNRLLRHLDDELAFHVAERIDELVAGGMSAAEARTEALRRFGNYTRQRERTRDMNIVAWLEALVADVKFGARQLRLNPGFTTVAVLSLALGIGANAAIFQLINALRLRSLPAVEKPWELASVDPDGDEFFMSGWSSARHAAFTYAQFDELRHAQQAFTGVLAFGTTRFNLARSGEARYAEGLYVSGNFLDLLGVRPAFGSGFTGNVDGLDCSHAGAILSHAFWQREFGGNPSAIGRALYVQGHMLPIVGITPAAFVGLEAGRRFDVAVPLCADALFAQEPRQRRQERRDAWWLALVGRLRPGWNVPRAAAHIRGLSPAIFEASLPPTYRPDEAGKYLENRFTVKDARAGLSSLKRYEDPLYILLTVAGLVLLIACANLANLLLARASARQREMAVRQAVGASRVRLIAQLCSESLLLAGIGAGLGLVVAQLASRGLVAFLTNQDEPVVLSLAFDRNVFGFITLLAMLTCLLFGVVPALKATSTPPAMAMQGGRGTAQFAEKHRLRRALVVIQVALSLVLLFGALLFGQTLRNLLTTESGMVPEGVLVASVDTRLPDLTPEHRRVVFNDIHERIAAQPGVTAVAQVWLSPFSGSGWNGSVREQGAGTDKSKEAWFNRISPGYFDTMKTTMLAGRDFGAQDTLAAPRVAVVNEEFARRVFGGGNPIGRAFRSDAPAGKEEPVYEVIGLVRNTKYRNLREEFKAIAFMPLAQDEEGSESVSFMVRSHVPLGTTMAGIRQLMGEMQRDVLVEFRVLDVQVAQSVLRERLMATVSGAFGLLATVLSTIGLYGVMAYMVARRKNEIGVRMALGARADHILRLVFLEAGRLVVLGLVAGAAGAYFAARYAQSLLFGLEFHDVRSLAVGRGLCAAGADWRAGGAGAGPARPQVRPGGGAPLRVAAAVRSTPACCCVRCCRCSARDTIQLEAALMIPGVAHRRQFKNLSEQEVLALAISSEEDDARIYRWYAQRLRADYPQSARAFEEMASQEDGHRASLVEEHRRRFGDTIPLLRREHVAGFYQRRPVWLIENLGLERIRDEAARMETETREFYEHAAQRSSDAGTRQLLNRLVAVEYGHETAWADLLREHLPPGARAEETGEAHRQFVLTWVQPGLAGLMDGSISTLAPIFAAAFATGDTWQTFLVGVAASVGAGISMGFTEAASDDGAISGRGSPVKRGLASGVMTTVGGLGHALPYLIPQFWTATGIAMVVVFVELWVIAWVQNRYMETPSGEPRSRSSSEAPWSSQPAS